MKYYIILGTLLLLSIILLIFLFLKYKKEKQHWSTVADENLRKGQDEAAEIIKRTIDTVNEDRRTVEKMSEKQLLVEIMLALGGQNRRFDRMEEKVQWLINCRSYIDELNSTINALKIEISSLQMQNENMETHITEAQISINKLTKSVSTFNNALNDVEGVQKKILSLNQNSNKLLEEMENIDSNLGQIQNKVQETLRTYREGPEERFDSVEQGMEKLKNDISELESLVKDIEEKVEEIRE